MEADGQQPEYVVLPDTAREIGEQIDAATEEKQTSLEEA